jgi:hypothetical protein
MADLNVKIADEELRVGDAANSKLSIDIENATPADVTYTLYVTLPSTLVDAKQTGSIIFNQTVEADPGPVPSGTRWRIGARRGMTITQGSKLTLTLSKIPPAAAGAHVVTIEGTASAKPDISVALPVTVLATNDVPKISSFEAERYVLSMGQSKPPPIKLKWEVDADSTVELWRLGTKMLPSDGNVSAPQQQKDWWLDDEYEFSGIQPYQLIATAKGRTVSRWLFVRVQDPGWNKAPCSQGAPTLLLNDGDNRMFGVFARNGEAGLYSLDPDKGTLGRQDGFICKVPAGMEQSPGVFFNNRIWLLGGSQVHPERCSNKVWCFDPTAKMSRTMDAPPWCARMGHTCAVFNNQMWILGGVDDNGNTLDDVYFSPDGKNWTKDILLKSRACLLSAIEYESTLWTFGGADAPFGTSLKKQLWRRAASDWQQVKFRARADQPATDDVGGDVFGSALCVDNHGKLYALVTQRASGRIVSCIVRLSGFILAQIEIEELGYPISDDKGWRKTKDNSAQAPFRLTAVSFKNVIFVASLVPGDDDGDDPSLTYLVRS